MNVLQPTQSNISIDLDILRTIYPKQSNEEIFSRLHMIFQQFKKTYGEPAVRVFSAPGRTEIGGNHTDHQHGCVLAATIDRDCIGAVSVNNSRTIRLLSEGYSPCEVSLDNLDPIETEKGTSNAIIQGITARLTALGYRISGFNAYVSSNVLNGSGLSSSAAFEVLLGNIMNGLFCNNEIDPTTLAQIGQYAENVYFGKPCGLLDQLTSALGGLIFIDFNDLESPLVERIDYNFANSGHTLCTIDSGANHADLTYAYANITQEMKAVSAFFGKEYLRQVELTELLRSAQRVRKITGDRAVQRAMHFFMENSRTILEAEQLRSGDFSGFLQTLKESGRSSYMYLQNVLLEGSSHEQALGFTLALSDILLKGLGGFRIQGGGFAGTIQVFVPNDTLQEFKRELEIALYPGCLHILAVRPLGGLELTQLHPSSTTTFI